MLEKVHTGKVCGWHAAVLCQLIPHLTHINERQCISNPYCFSITDLYLKATQQESV